jgi:hypothetical protein
VTNPLVDTLATLGLELDQVTIRPFSVLPSAPFGVAENCRVSPTVSEADDGETTTLATGEAATVTELVPVFPPLVATTDAAPGATPMTCPVDETVATPGFDDAHATGLPSELPRVSRATALSCVLCPIARLRELGLTSTEAT